jgi:hypothetical protein
MRKLLLTTELITVGYVPTVVSDAEVLSVLHPRIRIILVNISNSTVKVQYRTP